MNKTIEKKLNDILSNTTDINETQTTIRTFYDDKITPFLTIRYDADMFVDAMEMYADEKVIPIDSDDMQEILDYVMQRQQEL